jgi:hypothetical protein
MESTTPEEAGASFSLNVSLMAFGAAIAASAAGLDCTSLASAKAGETAKQQLRTATADQAMDVIRI